MVELRQRIEKLKNSGHSQEFKEEHTRSLEAAAKHREEILQDDIVDLSNIAKRVFGA